MSVPPMPIASTCPSSSATRSRAALRSPPTPRRTSRTRRPSSSISSSTSRLADPSDTLTTVLSGRPGTRTRLPRRGPATAPGWERAAPGRAPGARGAARRLGAPLAGSGPGSGAARSGQRLGVPVEDGLGVDREREPEPLPEPPRARVVAVDAGEHPPRASFEPPLEVACAGAADAAVLDRRQHEQQVHGGVALLGVVELVVEVADDVAAGGGVEDRGLDAASRRPLEQHELGVAPGVVGGR